MAKVGNLNQTHKVDPHKKGGSAGAIADPDQDLKPLINFLKNKLNIQNVEGSPRDQLAFLKAKLKERDASEQVEILKQIGSEVQAPEGSSLKAEIKALAKEVVQSIKDRASGDQAAPEDIGNNRGGLDEVAGPQDSTSNFIGVEQTNTGLARKPVEKSLGFMLNFAGHQDEFFDESSMKFAEFAADSDKSKALYKLARDAQKFWSGEKEYLQDLKGKPGIKDNPELQSALRDLFTLQMQRGSAFDVELDRLIKGPKALDTGDNPLDAEIAAKKEEISALLGAGVA